MGVGDRTCIMNDGWPCRALSVDMTFVLTEFEAVSGKSKIYLMDSSLASFFALVEKEDELVEARGVEMQSRDHI